MQSPKAILNLLNVDVYFELTNRSLDASEIIAIWYDWGFVLHAIDQLLLSDVFDSRSFDPLSCDKDLQMVVIYWNTVGQGSHCNPWLTIFLGPLFLLQIKLFLECREMFSSHSS